MQQPQVKLSLIENSHSFLKEAVDKAILAEKDSSQWQFAILNLVQSLELLLKEVLRKEHPIFIYEDIDNPKNTISISKALLRIENKLLLDINLSESDKKKIKEAINLRNKITHYEFEFPIDYARAKFSELFAFTAFFQSNFLKFNIEDILDSSKFQEILKTENHIKELKEKAYKKIEEENIDKSFIWECPNCGEKTFVIEDGLDICFLCRYSDEITECEYCNNYFFSFEMESFDDLLEIFQGDFDMIHNSYGYSVFEACPNCIGKIRDDIENQKENDYYEYLERTR